jgi:hypothetical protein
MNGKIETGCTALVVRSSAGNEGIVVTVGRYLGEVSPFIGHHRWEVDRELKT